jgi:hypothetical protein
MRMAFYINQGCLAFNDLLVAYSKFMTAFCTAGCQYTAAIGRCHASLESVLVPSFSLGGLKRPFHSFSIRECKDKEKLFQ